MRRGFYLLRTIPASGFCKFFGMKLTITIIVLLLSNFIFSQNKDLGSWNVVNVQYDINPKWEVYTELQTRSNRFFDNFFYYEIKGGIGYKINKHFSFLLGTGRYATYSDEGNFVKPLQNEEFRIWQQINMKQYLGRLKIEHRYRAEQKWLNDGYRNRFRYRLSAEVPVNKAKTDRGAVYVNISDEIFLNNRIPHFERNRFFAGAGYVISPVTAVQAGYVYQYNYKLNQSGGKSFLQLYLLFQLQNEGKEDRKSHLID